MRGVRSSIIIGASLHETILEDVFNRFVVNPGESELLVGCSDEAPASISITRQYAANHPATIRLAQHVDMPSSTADLNAALLRLRGEVVLICSDPRDLAQLDVRAAATAMTAAGAAFAVWSWGASVSTELFAAVYGRLTVPRCILVNRDLLDRLGPLDDTLRWSAVWDYQLRAASIAQGVIVTTGQNLHHEFDRSRTAAQLHEATGILRRFGTNCDCDPGSVVATLAAELEIGDAETLEFAAHAATLPWHPPSAATVGARLTFILTLPRSGSTLLQRLLAQHPDLHSLPEPWIMLPLTRIFSQAAGEGAYDQGLAHQAVDSFLSSVGASEDTLYKLVRTSADQLYRRALYGCGKSRFVDKTPRYYQIAPLLAKLYPAARFIILVRHPGAVLSSMLKTWCDDDVEVLRNNIVYQDLTQGPALLVEAQQLLGSSAVTISYEQLVTDPESVLRTLCAHLDLPWTDRVLRYDDASWPSNGFGDEGRITQHHSAVASYQQEWRARLTSQPEIAGFTDECFEMIGAETLAQLGYTKDGVEPDALSRSADQLTSEGERLYAQGRTEDAIRAFKSALDLDAGFTNAHNNLGVAYWQAGDLAAALQSLKLALDGDPGNTNVLVNLLEVLDATGRLRDALPALDRYLHAHPDAREIANLRQTLVESLATDSQPVV